MSSSSYDRSLELVAELVAAGVNATADPRSATPPCVLVTPPRRTYDLGCGYSAEWNLWALVPNPGNADAHKALAAMVDELAAVLPITTADPGSYALGVGEPFPAYQCQFTEAL